MYDCVLVYFLWYVTQKIVNVCVIMSVNLFVDICCKYFAVFLFKKAIKELLVFFIPLDLHRTKLREPGSRGEAGTPSAPPLAHAYGPAIPCGDMHQLFTRELLSFRPRSSVTLSTKSTKFGSRYVVDRLSGDEIWYMYIVSPNFAVHHYRDW